MRERLAPEGRRNVAIRIDSGDITYLSKTARKMLDEAGFKDCKILASNSLDEYIIRDIIAQGARVDLFGVGERLITSESEPVFGGVYKLAALERPDGGIIPKLKISENVEKITIPGNKQVYRLYDNANGKAIADVITLADEHSDGNEPYELFDPESTWKRKTVSGFTAKPLLEQIFVGGARVHEPLALSEIRARREGQVETLWEEVLRFENPQKYYVDLSQRLWDIKYGMLHKMSRREEHEISRREEHEMSRREEHEISRGEEHEISRGEK
jgi:nicotinate phosphoribosyltransferase